MPFGSLSNVLEIKSAEGFRGSSVLQQSYPLTGYTVGAAPTPPAFTPLSLFSGGVQGVWYDPSDLTTMFTDSAGTTPVGTPGNGSAQPVGLLLDKSQNAVGTNGAYYYNKLTYTEQFDNGYWVKSQSSVSSNTTTAPDGTTTADSLIENTAGAAHYLNTTAISGLNSSVINTFSVALKANTRTAARIYLAETGYGGYAWGDFDLSSGTVYGSAGTAGTATSASASITSLGNGWYRCTITAKAGTGNTTCFVQINLLNQLPAPSGDSYTGNGTSGIYVWGAQATVSTAPTAYQKITSDWVSTMAGNHATQSTASARPELSALYNILLNTDTLSTQSVTTVAATYTLSFSGAGTITLTGTKTGVYTAGTNTLTGVTAGTLTLTVAGTVTNADLRISNDGVGLPTYQRVGANAQTYDAVGFPYYLKADGVNTIMSTGNIDFSGTNKVFLCSGLRKLAVNSGIPIEFTANSYNTNGSFGLWAIDPGAGGNAWTWNSDGSFRQAASYGDTSPVTRVVSGIGDISAPLATLRLNGSQVATTSLYQGTGNYANAPLYLFSRTGMAYQYNGRAYGIIIRGASSTATEITNTETWMNGKTKAY